MSAQDNKVLITLPKELHIKLKQHAAIEMRSLQRQVVYILDMYAREKKLLPPLTHTINTDDLDFVDE